MFRKLPYLLIFLPVFLYIQGMVPVRAWQAAGFEQNGAFEKAIDFTEKIIRKHHVRQMRDSATHLVDYDDPKLMPFVDNLHRQYQKKTEQALDKIKNSNEKADQIFFRKKLSEILEDYADYCKRFEVYSFPSEATRNYRELISTIYLKLALSLETESKWLEAYGFLRRGLEIYPESEAIARHLIHRSYAEKLTRLGTDQHAYEEYQRLRLWQGLKAKDEIALFLILLRQGKTTEALESLKSGLKKTGDAAALRIWFDALPVNCVVPVRLQDIISRDFKEMASLRGVYPYEIVNILNAMGFTGHFLSDGKIGSTEVVTPVHIYLISKGFYDGNGGFAEICINEVNLAPRTRGYNVVVLDPVSGEVMKKGAFDTCKDSTEENNAFINFLKDIPQGHIVVLAASDDASSSLSQEAVEQIQSVGAEGDLRGKLRWAHGVIGVKGAKPGTAFEVMSEHAVQMDVQTENPHRQHFAETLAEKIAGFQGAMVFFFNVSMLQEFYIFKYDTWNFIFSNLQGDSIGYCLAQRY